MSEPDEERQIEGLEALKAPARSDMARQRAREGILAQAALLLARRRARSSWEVLTAWARPGLIAASIALAFLLGTLRPERPSPEPALPPVALEDVLRARNGSEPVPSLLVATVEPDADAVIEAALLDANSNEGER